MATSRSNEELVFNFRTLRVIIGALALAFPCAVVGLTGTITTSISASYHDPQTRNVFVGFMFIIGALLVSYKGHKLIVPNSAGNKLGVLAKRYEEDLVSILGGMAAIVTALSPTARDGYPMDTRAAIHTVGAFILFAAIVYFSLIAFMRSVNIKLLKYAELKENPELEKQILAIRNVKEQTAVNPFLKLMYRLFPDAFIFPKIAFAGYRIYNAQQQSKNSGGTGPLAGKAKRFLDLWTLYGLKLTRGWIYLVCGSLIALVLLAFLVVLWAMPDLVSGLKLTFWVETVALGLFGVAWMTASQLRYVRKIGLFLKLRRPNPQLVTQLGEA